MTKPHLFDPKKIDVLDAEERKIWQNPEKILGITEIKPMFVVADIGCGSGFFTLPVSEKVSKVYAVDVQMKMLESLEHKISSLKIKNIESLLAGENEIPLESNSVDLLLSMNTLHEFDDKEKMAFEMRRVLKQGGKTLIADWKKEDTGFGPPVDIRVSSEQAVSLFNKMDFNLLKKEELLYHYLLVFQKK